MSGEPKATIDGKKLKSEEMLYLMLGKKNMAKTMIVTPPSS